MTTLPLPRLHPARIAVPQKLSSLRPNRTVALALVGVLSLAASATVTVIYVQEQAARAAVISEHDATLRGLGESMEVTESTLRLEQVKEAEYRGLMLEQDAAFANVEGFLQ